MTQVRYDAQAFLDAALHERYGDPSRTDRATHEAYGLPPDLFDRGALHISDLSQCVRAVWYRRNGTLGEPIAPRRRITMVRGLAIEQEIVAALSVRLHVSGYATWSEREPQGAFAGWLSINAEQKIIAGTLGHSLPPKRYAQGHIDLLAINARMHEVFVYEIKSVPFLGSGPQAKHVVQLAGYTAMQRALHPNNDIRGFVIEVSAVTGEYKCYALDHAQEEWTVKERLSERLWTTAPGDSFPQPSIPEENFVPRGRGSKKRLVNLLCERYCDYRVCAENHVGEEDELADE